MKHSSNEQAPSQERTPVELEKVIELITRNPQEISLWPDDLKDVKFSELVEKIEASSERNKMVKNLLSRYYDNDNFKLRDSKVLITAPHSVLPGPKEMQLTLKQYTEFADLNEELTLEQYQAVIADLKASGYPEEASFKEAKKRLRVDYQQQLSMNQEDLTTDQDEIEQELDGSYETFVDEVSRAVLNLRVKLKILTILAGNDALAGNFAKDIAGEDLSLALPRFSRRMVDFNRPIGNRKIVKKGTIKRMEFGQGAQLAQRYSLTELVGKLNDGIDTIYQVNILERDDDKPITIAFRERDGKLPCNPEVVEQLAQRIEKEISDNEMIKPDGKMYKVKIATEGDFSGAKVNHERRWGKGEFKGFELGDGYQFIQLGIPSRLIRNYKQSMAEVLSKALQEIGE